MLHSALNFVERLARPTGSRLRHWLRAPLGSGPRPAAEEALQAAGVGTWEWEIATGRVCWSSNMEALHGLPPGSFDGTFSGFLQLVHPDDRATLRDALGAALDHGTPYHVEYRERGEDGRIRWIDAVGQVIRAGSGRPERMVGVCMEVTEKKRAELLARLLADAGSAIARSLEVEETLTALAKMLVPDWADWCVVDLLNERREIEDVVIEHGDPEKVQALRALRRRSRPTLADASGVGHVIRTGEPQVLSSVSDDVMRAIARDQAHLEALRGTAVRSGVMVPMVAQDRVLGALTLVSAESPIYFTEKDLPQIQELATHCALAVDNARLHQRTRRELEERVSQRTAELEERAEQLRRMTVELTRAEYRERRKLAEFLHDDHQQVLVAARMRAERLEAQESSKLAAGVIELLDEAIQSARSLSHELSPGVLHTCGLVAALEWLVPRKWERYGVRLHVDASREAEPESEEVRLLFFRLARELLLNVAKHAETEDAWVSLSRAAAGMVELTVEDHGRGFALEELERAASGSPGLGLSGMKERLLPLGGHVEVESAPQQGTRVTLRIPGEPAGSPSRSH